MGETSRKFDQVLRMARCGSSGRPGKLRRKPPGLGWASVLLGRASPSGQWAGACTLCGKCFRAYAHSEVGYLIQVRRMTTAMPTRRASDDAAREAANTRAVRGMSRAVPRSGDHHRVARGRGRCGASTPPSTWPILPMSCWPPICSDFPAHPAVDRRDFRAIIPLTSHAAFRPFPTTCDRAACRAVPEGFGPIGSRLPSSAEQSPPAA